MPFTEAARFTRVISQRVERELILHEKGWSVPLTSVRVLEGLGIEYEVTRGDYSWTRGGGGIFAPTWVYGVVDRARSPISRSVMLLLGATRDDVREQRLICAELVMDNSIPDEVRKAATNYVIQMDRD